MVDKSKIDTILKKLQKKLDYCLINDATSGWMEKNTKNSAYICGSEIKIPEISYQKEHINLNYKTMKMKIEQTKSFFTNINTENIGDLDESQLFNLLSETVHNLQQEIIIPEIDAYRYSKIAYEAIKANNFKENCKPTEETILEDLINDIAKIRNKIGYNIELIISLNSDLLHVLKLSDTLHKTLQLPTFKQSNLMFEIETIDKCQIINIPSPRMFTEYEFKSDLSREGFETTKDSKVINWIITTKDAPLAVSKTKLFRLPSSNEAVLKYIYPLKYIKHHDLWILPNNLDSIFVNIQ